MELLMRAERRSRILAWAGLGFMGMQFGFLARLTWWEYSWDIIEPVTYFVTYGTAMALYAYYLVTRQVSVPDGRLFYSKHTELPYTRNMNSESFLN